MAALPAAAEAQTVRRGSSKAADESAARFRRSHLPSPPPPLPPPPARPLAPCQAELTFDGVAYILSVRCTGGDTLEVVVERKEDASAWAATFAAKCECGCRGRRGACSWPCIHTP